MPEEAREKIHELFEGHGRIERSVEIREDGYVAVTESEDPALASALRKHVGQMVERLESGMMVRRWDPAFAEYGRHYGDIEHEVRRTARGIRVVVRGKTDDAVKVAQNHAKVIGEFVDKGWAAHDERHAAVLEEGGAAEAGGGRGRGRGRGPGRGFGHGHGHGHEDGNAGRADGAGAAGESEACNRDCRGGGDVEPPEGAGAGGGCPGGGGAGGGAGCSGEGAAESR